jgi:hypothetical protein
MYLKHPVGVCNENTLWVKEAAVARHAEDIFVDKKDQLEKIEETCLPEELIHAVFDLKGRGTGFIGITNKRVIYYDKEFIGGKKAIVSIPHHRIVAIASEDNKGLFVKKGFFTSDTLTIYAVGLEAKEFEFRGSDKAHLAHDLLLSYIL